MSDAAMKRSGDTKDLTDKQEAKATIETELQTHTDAKKASEEELKAVKDYIQTLHNDCDFLLEYYSERKEARASESKSTLSMKLSAIHVHWSELWNVPPSIVLACWP